MEDAKTVAILERLILASNAKTDAALAQAIGVSPQSVSEGRRKNKIPPAWAIVIAEKYQVSLDWLLLGRQAEQGQQPAPEQGQPHAATTEPTAACSMCREMLRQLGIANELALEATKRATEATEKGKELLEQKWELQGEIAAINMENAELEALIDGLQKQLSLSANKEDDRAHQEAV